MKKRKFNDGGIFREGMQVPQDIDGGSAPKPPMKRPAPKKSMPKKPMMPVAPKGRGPGMAADESAMPAPAFKQGGSVGSASRRADGIAKKGKTKGTMVAMKGGGYAC